MKKFTRIILCLILCFCCLNFGACKNEDALSIVPADNTGVTGNGGLAVLKDNQLFFSYGFVSIDDLDDKSKTYETNGALYTTILDDEGNPIVDSTGSIASGYYSRLSKKLCAYEATNLYVFGNYIYFVSPCLENTAERSQDAVWAKERVVFYRAKIDGSTEPEKLYQSTIGYTSLSFKYYLDNGKLYLLVWEQGTNLDDSSKEYSLLRIDINNNASVQSVATNVSSIIMENPNNDNDFAHIYFVCQEGDDYNLYQYNVSSNSKTNLSRPTAVASTTEMELLSMGKDYIYFTAEDGDYTNLYRKNIKANSSFEFVTETSSLGDVHVLPDDSAVIAFKENSIQFVLPNNSGAVETNMITDADVDTLEFIGYSCGNIIYSDDEDNIKIVSYADYLLSNKSNNYVQPSIYDIADREEHDSKFYFDIDGEYMYILNAVDGVSYLFRVQISNNTGNTVPYPIAVDLEYNPYSDEEE